MVWWCL